MDKSANERYDSRDDSSSPIGIIAIINSTINHGYDSRDDFNCPVGIIAMINSTVNHSYDSRDDFNSPIKIIMMIKIYYQWNHIMILRVYVKSYYDWL